jgi:hypothetical protein
VREEKREAAHILGIALRAVLDQMPRILSAASYKSLSFFSLFSCSRQPMDSCAGGKKIRKKELSFSLFLCVPALFIKG